MSTEHETANAATARSGTAERLGLPTRIRACLFDLDGVLHPDGPAACRGLNGDVRLLKVEVTAAHATYEVLEGPSLELAHHGEVVTVVAGEPLTLELPPVPQWPTPMQPPGRAPVHRGKDQREAAQVPPVSGPRPTPVVPA